MLDGLTIRQATIDDAQDVVRMVSSACSGGGCEAYYSPNAGDIAAFIEASIERPELALVLVAALDGKAIGTFLGVSGANPINRSCTSANEVAMYVAPEHRGHGVARALVSSFEAWGKSHGRRLLSMTCSQGPSRKSVAHLCQSFGLRKAETIYVRVV